MASRITYRRTYRGDATQWARPGHCLQESERGGFFRLATPSVRVLLSYLFPLGGEVFFASLVLMECDIAGQAMTDAA